MTIKNIHIQTRLNNLQRSINILKKDGEENFVTPIALIQDILKYIERLENK